MELSALIERRGGVFLFRGLDGVERYIENHYRDKEYVGWLLWEPETLKILKMLNPKCYVKTGLSARPYIISTGFRVAEAIKKCCHLTSEYGLGPNEQCMSREKIKTGAECLRMIGPMLSDPRDRDEIEVVNIKNLTWIPVDERLPKCNNKYGVSKVVWCADAQGKVGFGIYQDGTVQLQNEGWFISGRAGEGDIKITHWMPIPRPPKGGKNNENY